MVRAEVVGVRGEQWPQDILWIRLVFARPVGVVAALEETREKDFGFDVVGIVLDQLLHLGDISLAPERVELDRRADIVLFAVGDFWGQLFEFAECAALGGL